MPRAFTPQPLEPIRVTPASRLPESAVEGWFFLVLRTIGALLILRALYLWFCFTGLLPAMAPAFAVAPAGTLPFALLTGSAIVSLIAGLGLWLLAPWGAVLWLVLVATDAVLFFLLPDLSAVRPLVVALNGVLVTAYLVLALMVRRQVRARTVI